MKYPGRVVRLGESDAALVIALRKALNKALALRAEDALATGPADAVFDLPMKRVVQWFQTRHVDIERQPLKADGEVGPITWAALFDSQTLAPAPAPPGSLLQQALAIAGAAADAKVREVPRNSNRGPEVSQKVGGVDIYQKRTGIPLGSAWCCAFTYWCFDEAARGLSRENPMLKTGHCLTHWNQATTKGALRFTTARVLAAPELLGSGMLFIIDHGGSRGHTGFVERVSGGYIHTIEGNTDASGTREGGGVYRLHRKIKDINKGFIDYGPT